MCELLRERTKVALSLRTASAAAKLTFLNTAKLSNGDAELLPDSGVGADAARDGPGGTNGASGQTHAAALGQALHEHVPAKAASFLATQNGRHGDPDLLSLDGAVHEGRVEGHVAGSHPQSLVVALQEGDSEALPALALEQAVGVAEVEAQTDDAGDGGQGDVALLEGGDDAQLAVALGDDAVGFDEAGGVGTGVRAGEAEAGDESAVGQAGEEVLLLLLRAVPGEELAGSQTVGHGDGGVGVEALGGQLLQDGGDGVGGEAEAAPLLGDLHPEELLGAHVVPCVLGEVAVDGHVVVVEEGAEGLDLVVHVGLLLGRQLGLVRVDQLLQRRRPGEDVLVKACDELIAECN